MPTYGLDFASIYGRIKDYANINNVVNADTKAKKAANDALRLISVMRYWEQLRREATINALVASQVAYAIATFAASFDRIISCWYEDDGTRYEIDLVDDDRWNRDSITDSGTPEICRVTKADGTLKIEFSPTPDASFISTYAYIYFDYVKKPAELSADNDVPDIPDTSQQMAIVYLAVSDLLGKQGDLSGLTAWEAKAMRLINTAHKIDDRKQGRYPRLGKPLIPINASGGSGMPDYEE